MKNSSQRLIAEVPRRQPRVEMTIGIDLGDVWSHYCTLNQDGEVVDRGRFRTTPKAIEKWFTDLPPTRVAMEAGVHSIWISEQLQELGHEVIVANVRELRAISHSDRKSDQVDAEKLARYARLDPNILRPISHCTVEQQEALTLIRARDLLVRLRTASVNAVRGLTKACGHRMPASSTRCFAERSLAVMPPGLQQALGPVLQHIAEMTAKIKHYDRLIQQLTQTEYPETHALLKVHGVGHITALTFVLTLGNKERFERSMTKILSAGHEVYTELLNLCVWAKSNGGMGSFYRSAHELVFLFKNGTGSHRNNIQLGKFGRYRTNVWNYPGANTFSRSDSEGNLLALHPTPKPVALIVDAIKDCTARGDLVLDPYLGSGTAVIAAERSWTGGTLMEGTQRSDSGGCIWLLEVVSRPRTRPSLRSPVSWPSCSIDSGPPRSLT